MFAIEKQDEVQCIEMVEYQIFRITIGDFQERFRAPISFWSPEQYESHWKEQIRRLEKCDIRRTCLVTELYPPETSNFVRMWVLYRTSDQIIFQEHLVFDSDLNGNLSIPNIEKHLPERERIDEDGNEISEWMIPADDVFAFSRNALRGHPF